VKVHYTICNEELEHDYDADANINPSKQDEVIHLVSTWLGRPRAEIEIEVRFDDRMIEGTTLGGYVGWSRTRPK
jgi:Holliday junction resolvase-like predicted endonuclease